MLIFFLPVLIFVFYQYLQRLTTSESRKYEKTLIEHLKYLKKILNQLRSPRQSSYFHFLPLYHGTKIPSLNDFVASIKNTNREFNFSANIIFYCKELIAYSVKDFEIANFIHETIHEDLNHDMCF